MNISNRKNATNNELVYMIGAGISSAGFGIFAGSFPVFMAAFGLYMFCTGLSYRLLGHFINGE